jgi:hypothetical protein
MKKSIRVSKMLKVQTNPVTGFSAYVHEDGRAFFTFNSLVKLIGIGNVALTKIIESKGVINYSSEFPELLTEGGFQGVINLVDCRDLKTIIRAYNPTSEIQKARKEEIIDTLLDAGSVAYAYHLCGYEMKKAEQPKLNPDETLRFNIESALKIETVEDPMIKSLLANKLKGILAETQNLLAGDLPIGAVHCAELLGYKCDRSISTRLGNYVVSKVKSLGRTSHGQYSVHTYNREDIEQHIHDFFKMEQQKLDKAQK